MPIDNEFERNEFVNTEFGEVRNTNNDGLTESKRKLKQAREQQRKKLKEESLEKRKVITDNIIEKDLNELVPHEVNVVLYGQEKVDDTLVDSILKKGQLEPIVVTKNDDEEKYTIISGHRRWMALKAINENKKGPIKLKEGSEVHYDNDHPLPFVDEMKARCVVVNLPTKESRILAIIDYNKRRKKRWSQYYNEIRVLHSLYDPEAEHARNKNLKQYSNSSDLKKRYKKEKSSKLKSKEYYAKLFDEGKITFNDILLSRKYKKVCTKDKIETTQKIADEIDLCRTNVIKLTKIGDLAYVKKDEVAIDIIERLDYDVWSLNNAFNIYKLREFQVYFKMGSENYKALNTVITKVLDVTKNHDKNVKEGIVTDKTVQQYRDIINEIAPKEKEKKKVKDLFSVILIEPDDSTEIEDIKASPNSALFVIANPVNLGKCIKLMNKLKYSTQTYYFFDFSPDDIHNKSILLLGTRNFDLPNPQSLPYISRDEVYNAIKELYPNQNYHEVPNKHSPREDPEGWEIPIGKTLSKKQEMKAQEKAERAKAEKQRAKKDVKEDRKQLSGNKKLANGKAKGGTKQAREVNKRAKEIGRKVKSVEKISLKKESLNTTARVA
jgi:hypothetical protein